jgi:hypothetical protein
MNMTTTQIELTRLDEKFREAAALLRDGVDAEMAEIDRGLRALARDIQTRSHAAMEALEHDAELRILATLPSQTTR